MSSHVCRHLPWLTSDKKNQTIHHERLLTWPSTPKKKQTFLWSLKRGRCLLRRLLSETLASAFHDAGLGWDATTLSPCVGDKVDRTWMIWWVWLYDHEGCLSFLGSIWTGTSAVHDLIVGNFWVGAFRIIYVGSLRVFFLRLLLVQKHWNHLMVLSHGLHKNLPTSTWAYWLNRDCDSEPSQSPPCCYALWLQEKLFMTTACSTWEQCGCCRHLRSGSDAGTCCSTRVWYMYHGSPAKCKRCFREITITYLYWCDS